MQPFPFYSSPFERFWRKTSGIVRYCSLHENLQLVSAEILIAALSHSQLPQEPHISRMPKTGLSRCVLGWSVRTVSPGGGTSRNDGSGTCPAAAPSQQRAFHVGGQSQIEFRVIADCIDQSNNWMGRFWWKLSDAPFHPIHTEIEYMALRCRWLVFVTELCLSPCPRQSFSTPARAFPRHPNPHPHPRPPPVVTREGSRCAARLSPPPFIPSRLLSTPKPSHLFYLFIPHPPIVPSPAVLLLRFIRCVPIVPCHHFSPLATAKREKRGCVVVLCLVACGWR